MENFIEPIRLTTTFAALATGILVARSVAPLTRPIAAWLMLFGGAGLVVTHLLRVLAVPALLPIVAFSGVALGFSSLFAPRVLSAFAELSDARWRQLMSIRAIFGSLLLAAGATGIMPAKFTLIAGVGDIVVGLLAIAVPGSLAVDGNRGSRLLVFGAGLLDFISVAFLIITVVVPFLRETQSPGISILLPWVAVPLLATVNAAGFRLALHRGQLHCALA